MEADKELALKAKVSLPHLKWITNKVLLSSTGHSAQCYVASWLGGGVGREQIPVYVC